MRTTLLLTLLTVTQINFPSEENSKGKGNGVDITPKRSTALAIPKKQSAQNSLSNSLTHYSPPPLIDNSSKLLTVCSLAAWATHSSENSPRDPNTTY